MAGTLTTSPEGSREALPSLLEVLKDRDVKGCKDWVVKDDKSVLSFSKKDRESLLRASGP
jgi:hypothetical protein